MFSIRHHRLNDQNLVGYIILCALFMAGLMANVIIANKIVALGPIIIPASAFFWATTFPISDITVEVYGRRYAHIMVLAGFLGYVVFLTAVQTSVFMPAADFWPHQAAYGQVLGTTLRVSIAALLSYVEVQTFDVHAFGWIREKWGRRRLWLRNNLSTICSQSLANSIFLFAAFWGTLSPEHWWHLFATNLLTRYVLLLVDTPVVYLGVYALYRAYPELRDDGPG